MRILITIMMLWSSTMAFGQEIWQLSPWAPDSSYVIGAMNSGEPTWVKVDSLGLADSIYLSGDSIKLRDGSGSVNVNDADANPSNEIQTLSQSFTGSTEATYSLNLSGGSVKDTTGFMRLETMFSTAGSRTYRYKSNLGAIMGITEDPTLSGNSNIEVLRTGNQLTWGLRKDNASNGQFYKYNGSAWALATAPTGTVTSVGLGLGTSGTDVNVSGSPITGSGSFTLNLPSASGSNRGLLTSTDWTRFNGNIGGDGVVTRIPIFSGSKSLTYDNNLSFQGGSLLIGTTAPVSGLPATKLQIVQDPAVADWTFYMKTSTVLGGSYGARIDGGSHASDYNFWINNSYPFIVRGNGRVGIGTSSPTQMLDVVGTARLRGAIYDSANSAGSSGQVLTSQGLGAWTWTTPNTGTVTSVGINTGGGVTSVSGSPVTGSGNISLTLADQSASNELQTISTSGTAGNITLSNGGGTLNLNVNDADDNATNELQNLTLTGQTLDISQGAGVTLPIIDVVQGSGITVNKLNGIATISASSAGSTEYLDPYVISSDTVGFILKNVMDTVQFIGVAGVTGESTTVSDSPTINMTLTGTNISSEVIDGSITPTKLSQTYLTSEVDGSTTNEIQTLSISGSNLTISGAGGNTITLPSGGGSSEWASLHYGSLAANTQTLTSSVWNTINFTGSSESNASVLDANHTNDEIEFVVAGTYRVDYRVSFIANADALIYSGIYSSASSSVDGNTQMESDTDSGYKHTIMQHSYIKTAVAGEKIKLQVQPLIAHTSVAIYSNFIVTKL